MKLIAYADESGIHDETGVRDGSAVLAVCGYISWQQDWEIFCNQWKAVLDCYGVQVFHMYDLSQEILGSPYQGWSREKKDEFVRELVAVARDNTLIGIGGLVSVRDYDEIVPDWLKTEVGHPYYFCFQLFIDSILEAISNKFEHPFPPQVQVSFCFDQTDKFKQIALKVFEKIESQRDEANRMLSIQFESKEKHIPLQAADLLVYRMRKVLTRKLKNEPAINKGSWDEELGARGNLIVNYYDAENLQDLIDRYMSQINVSKA